MSWNRKYWDIHEQLYWTPRYIGLRSIPKESWQRANGLVAIPEHHVEGGRALYYREHKIKPLVERLNGNEEVLNHLFDLTFGIAPDQVIREVFLTPLGFTDSGSFESVGREIRQRFGWSDSENVTQQDGFFVSDETAVATEIKLGSLSSPAQVMKYAALLAWEELNIGKKRQLGLIYFAPESARGGHWTHCGLAGANIDRTFLTTRFEKDLPSSITKLLAEHRESVASMLDRMRLAFVSWTELYGQLSEIRNRLDQSQPGEQTLYRLLEGFLAQLQSHRGAGLSL